jgi:hypothetical protein
MASGKIIREHQEAVLWCLRKRLGLPEKSMDYNDYIKQAIDRGETFYKNAFKDNFTTVEEIKNIEI